MAMNIFCLDSDPKVAAQLQCDKHVVKMTLESAQMLCTTHRFFASSHITEKFYRLTHQNHPCAIWTRETSGNYMWLYNHFCGLCEEYTFRYGKKHLTEMKLRNDLSVPPDNIKFAGLTPFVLALPDQFKKDCPIQSYREYYLSKATQFSMKWTKREVPDWFRSQENHYGKDS